MMVLVMWCCCRGCSDGDNGLVVIMVMQVMIMVAIVIVVGLMIMIMKKIMSPW